MIKILFLAANPSDTTRLRVDEESRAIDQALRQAEFRAFAIEKHFAVRVADLQGFLLRHQPDIVHFSGHGSSMGEILLEDNTGNSHPVSVRALSQLFLVLKDNVRCVVLNACYSEPQAQAIARHIDCVIGIADAIGDRASVSFATAFYQALGYGRDVKTAFALGRLQIDLENLGEEDQPQLLAITANPSEVVFVSKPSKSTIHITAAENTLPTVEIEGPPTAPLEQCTYYTIISQNAVRGRWSIGGFRNEPVVVEPLGPSHQIFVQPKDASRVGDSFTIVVTVYNDKGQSVTARKQFQVVSH